ncbi:MAG: radical SAM protein [Acidobacteria bacterium]|nr:radical SAM protein [Acidobacteriota bacterium]
MTVPASIYGPVKSWRLGRSLGVDVLCIDSICSFECVYCQLGKINRVTAKRGVFVKTEKVIADLRLSDWTNCDVITFSGSGEPTLAANLGEIITEIKRITAKPVIVLTNSTLLDQKAVRDELALADRVFCKLDAWSDETLRRFDRPAAGITFESIVSGIIALRKEFKGILAIQTMLLRTPHEDEIEELAEILSRIRPDEVQLNLPTRPVPRDYFVETRGNEVTVDETFTNLKTISKEELKRIAAKLRDLTGLDVVSR